MTQIDVTLTDYLLCAQALWFAAGTGRLGRRSPTATYLQLTFIGFAAASLAGGTTHGFFNATSDPLHAPLWWLTLWFVGVTAAGFALTGIALLQPRFEPIALWAAAVTLVLYTLFTVVHPDFLVAILFYVPATLICLAGLIRWYRHHGGQDVAYGIAGILISLLAPVVQQLKLSLHPVYLTYNAVYHLILMLALYLFYRGAKQVLLAQARLDE